MRACLWLSTAARLSALIGSYFTQSPYATSENTLQGLSSAHWFGTDKVGRDVFARVIAGSSDILVVSTLATLLGVVGALMAIPTAAGLILIYQEVLVPRQEQH